MLFHRGTHEMEMLREEHGHMGNKDSGTPGKRVIVLGDRHYDFMGEQTIGNYTYLGFKERGTAEWEIMQIDNTDASAWQYAFSETSANTWATAWGAPASESYGNPPDS